MSASPPEATVTADLIVQKVSPINNAFWLPNAKEELKLAFVTFSMSGMSLSVQINMEHILEYRPHGNTPSKKQARRCRSLSTGALLVHPGENVLAHRASISPVTGAGLIL